MENEIRNTVPVSYTKCLWAFVCLGGAVPLWLAILWSALLENNAADLLLYGFFSGFSISGLVFPAALATALWAKRRNWRRNVAGCLKTVGAGGVYGGAYAVLLMAFISGLHSSGSWNRGDWEFARFFVGLFAVCGMVSAAVLSVLFLPKPDK